MLVKVICRMLAAVAASMALASWRMTALASPSLEIREEFDHLGVRFISVHHQIDTDSPVGRAMFTIIGAMAELESSLISERVTAGMRAAEARGKHLGRPATTPRVIEEIEALARSTDLSIRQIQKMLGGRASRGIVGEVTKRARSAAPPALCSLSRSKPQGC